MAGSLVTRALRRSLADIRHVSAVRLNAAEPLVAGVYRQMEQDFGLIAPPVALHAPAPEVLAASWLMLRETMVASAHAKRSAKELVASTVSVGNACPYCVAVHGATLRGLLPGPTSAAVLENSLDTITDSTLRALAGWVRAAGSADTAVPLPVVLRPAQEPELIGVAVVFQYLNRMVNVFLGDSPLPANVPDRMRGPMMRILGRFMRSSAVRSRVSGRSLDLLPDALLPPDLSWAAGSAHVAGAFRRAAAAIDAAGARAVSAPVRRLVSEELAGWRGQPRGLSRTWAADAAAALPPADRAAGRLALLTAFASYQIDQAVIDDFRLDRPGDATLVETTAWASFAAARRVGSWIPCAAPVAVRRTSDRSTLEEHGS